MVIIINAWTVVLVASCDEQQTTGRSCCKLKEPLRQTAATWSHNDKRLSMTTSSARAASCVWIVDDRTGTFATWIC